MLGGHTADAEQSQRQARDIAFLPASLGGLGLMHAERLSPAAYWAAWADALPVLQQRCPEAAARCLQELRSGNQAAAPSLQAAAAAGEHLDSQGVPALSTSAWRAGYMGEWLATGCCSRTSHFFPRACPAASRSAQRPCVAALPSRPTCRGMACRHPC